MFEGASQYAGGRSILSVEVELIACCMLGRNLIIVKIHLHNEIIVPLQFLYQHTCQVQPECMDMSRPTRDGTAEPVSQDQILRHERGQRNINFPYSADHVQDWQPYPVDPYSCYMCVTIHTSCTRPKSLSGLVLQSRIIVVLAYRRRGTKTSVNSPFSSKKPVTRPNFNRKKKRLSSLAQSLHQSTLI